MVKKFFEFFLRVLCVLRGERSFSLSTASAVSVRP
jgi:hypothetical protein